jgi:hypothetical protein
MTTTRPDARERQFVLGVVVENGQRHAWILAQVLKSLAAFVHADQEAAVLPEVPRGDGDRLAVRPYRRDH